MFDLWTAAPTHPNGAIPERHQTRVVQNPSAARPERCHRFRPLFLLCYPACAFGRAGGWVVAPRSYLGLCGWGLAGVVLPRLCFRRAWGVGGGAEIVFGVVWVGVGGCCATPFVFSAGLGGGWWHRDHIWGSSGDGRVEFENPQTTIPSHIRAPEISGNSDTAASTSPRPYPSG